MKLRNKIAAITAAAMLAFTGVGFAAWVFTNKVNTSDITVSDSVRCAVELNDGFAAYKEAACTNAISALYLICDAPEDNSDNLIDGKGIYWSTTNDGTAFANKIENIYIGGTLNYNKEDYKDISGVVVGVTVRTGAEYLGAITGTTYVTATAMTDGADINVTLPVDTDAAVAVKSAAIALPTVAYASVPTNVAGVTALNSEVTTNFNGKKIGYTVAIKSVIA